MHGFGGFATIGHSEDDRCATTDDVAKGYMQSWKLGCKGTTVYVTGSRDKVVLETKSTMESKQEGAEVLPADAKVAEPEQAQMPLWHDKKKARPHSLHGFTYRSDTPVGKAFITINEKTEKEKRDKVTYLFQAGSFEQAKKSVVDVMGGTMIDYEIVKIEETKIMDVFEYARKDKEETED